MLTPQALAVMSAVLVVWGVSQFFGVGQIADVILLIAGGLMLGAAAIDVATELAGFVSWATGSDIGSRPGSRRPSLRRNAAGGAADGNARRGRRGPPQKIPAAARVATALQQVGEQPRLGGMPENVAQAVRALLNHLRRNDMDCWGGCLKLQEVGGEPPVVS
jgi:hypothetical protein